MRDAPPACPDRRRLLLSLASGAALPLLSACSGEPPRDAVTVVPGDDVMRLDEPPVDLPLATLAQGQPATVQWGRLFVEVRRTPTGVEARALLCTHQGCRLAWDGETASYRCACHDGRFDADGAPIAGAPTRPMFRVPLLVSATTVHVGARPPA
ncbi:MAG: Rieske (2Fe-2S) protein [Vicinamibacterales bacterium]|nr:Rieske (2Fe-2S) protein [Vicinamibacterales bacterium]